MHKAVAVIRRRPETRPGHALAMVEQVTRVAARTSGCTLNTAAALPAPPSPEDLTAIVELYAPTEPEVRDAALGLRDELSSVASTDGYLVHERRPVSYRRTWPDGTTSPGMRMLSLCHRIRGTHREDFDAYWRDHHTAVACSFTVPIWNYTQDVVVDIITPDAPELDGVAGLHFRSVTDWVARYQGHPDEAARGAADAARFMDVARAEAMFATETILSTAPDGATMPVAALTAHQSTEGQQ